MTDGMPRSRGHLTPGSPGVRFERFLLDDELRHLVRHVWLVSWNVAEEVAQRALSYPAVNIVFEPGGTRIYGPNSSVSIRRLAGRSWAVGILFRPAAAILLAPTHPAHLRQSGEDGEPVSGAPDEAVAAIASRTLSGELTDAERTELREVLSAWLRPYATLIDDRGHLLNTVCDAAENDTSMLRAADLAASVSVSSRSLERLLAERLDVTPKWLIECRRMQTAATRLYGEPAVDLTELAIDLGFVDYAHFSRRYKAVLGETPDDTRAAGVRVARRRVEAAAD